MKIATILLTLTLLTSTALSADTQPASKPATTAATAPATAPALAPALAAFFKDGIALLEVGKNREAIERLAAPAELAQLKATPEKFDEVVASFGGQRAAAVLALLKEVQNATPTLNDDGTQAAFKLQGGDEPASSRSSRPKNLDLIKIGDQWYIKGH